MDASGIQRLETAFAYDGGEFVRQAFPQLQRDAADSVGPLHDDAFYFLVPLFVDYCHKFFLIAVI